MIFKRKNNKKLAGKKKDLGKGATARAASATLKMRADKSVRNLLLDMPSSPNYVRDYKQEYRTDSPLRKAKRRSRLKARRKLIKAGVAKKGDGKDVHHKDGNALNNKRSNLSVVSARKTVLILELRLQEKNLGDHNVNYR